MGLEQDVGQDSCPRAPGACPRGEGPVAADVIPGPAIKAAFGDARDVVGGKIVAQPVALVDRAPEIPLVDGCTVEARTIAQAGRIDALVAVRRN